MVQKPYRLRSGVNNTIPNMELYRRRITYLYILDFSYFQNGSVSILEIGFGTGLNAMITILESEKQKLDIDYTGVEAYPISPDELAQLNYLQELNALTREKEFHLMHSSAWEEKISITPQFKLIKQKKDFTQIADINNFNLIYFDAFGARVQPELWTVPIFEIMYNSLKKDGYLVTYAAKGSVRRAMLEVGFLVERLPGPPGKREMLRAKKP